MDSGSCTKKKELDCSGICLFFFSFFLLYIGIKVAGRACSLVNRCSSVEESFKL